MRLKKTRAIVTELQKSAEAISGIIGIIEQIAAQTNLLALNVPSKRWGQVQPAKDFAVVASEVKDLARKSEVSAHLQIYNRSTKYNRM
jgi:methyl-accepting chemotaxis protein